jgi:hypothetical protein
MNINFADTPSGFASSYEDFLDFFFEIATDLPTGYKASLIPWPGERGYIIDLNNDGMIEGFTGYWTDPSGKITLTAGTISWDNGIFLMHLTAGASPGSTSSPYKWGRFAYNAQGEVVGVYLLDHQVINPVFALTPDTNPGDALIATFSVPTISGTWSLLDNQGHDGVIDSMTRVRTYFDENSVQTTHTTTYVITWSDSTHWSAREIGDLGFGMTFDSQGRPTTIPYYTHTPTTPDVLHEIPIVWQTKGPDNVVAMFDLSGVMSGKFLDTNGDNLPDQVVFTSIAEGGETYITTTVGNFDGWSSLSSSNPHLMAEVQTSTDRSLQFSGTITGDSSNPITITMPSYFMGGGNTNIVPAVDYPLLVPVTHNGDSVNPDRYSGPATAAGGAPIHFQFIGDSTGEVVIGTTYNDFINVAGGVDAVNAGAGNDVIDGGTGSNFLTGGAGTDIFFSDGRGGVTTWSTITDWQAGEQLSVWGWHPGTSKIIAWVQAGAAGYEGLTMHADLNGDGVIDTSVTFTGIVSQSQLPTPLEFDGVLWFV